jgi:calcineurin-like phosphoesterase family protein
VLCHYGLRVWDRSHHGALHLYGHSHGTLPGDSQSLDVGVDGWEFTPVNIEQVRDRMKTMPKRPKEF